MMFDTVYGFWSAMFILWALGAALMSWYLERYASKTIAEQTIPANTAKTIILWASVLWPVTVIVAVIIQFFRMVTYFEGPR